MRRHNRSLHTNLFEYTTHFNRAGRERMKTFSYDPNLEKDCFPYYMRAYIRDRVIEVLEKHNHA